MDDIINHLKLVKEASQHLALLSDDIRQQVLFSLAQELITAWPEIVKANEKDRLAVNSDDPLYDRLLLSEERIKSIANDVNNIAALAQPLGNTILDKHMPNGLQIKKISVPLGVVAVIYESRPNVTIDVFALCFKAGNACVLKGGKEAHHSNNFLVSLIHDVLRKHHIDPNILYLLPPQRQATLTLLTAINLVDVCIPRGSQSLINAVRDQAKIPVIETGAGIVHTYFDVSGDLEKGRLIINNAKTRRVSVCNALDTLIIHQDRLADLPELVALLSGQNVEILADELSYQALDSQYPKNLLHRAGAEDFGQEFLSYKMAVKTVSTPQEAISHIMQYTSAHSEAIIAEDQPTIDNFLMLVDAAVVYVNASTAFSDGRQFGMGAEIGISTQKLHARGPMALEALTSYKWVVLGDGHIRS